MPIPHQDIQTFLSNFKCANTHCRSKRQVHLQNATHTCTISKPQITDVYSSPFMKQSDSTSPVLPFSCISACLLAACSVYFVAVTWSNFRRSLSEQGLFACISMSKPSGLHWESSIRMEAEVFPASLQLPLCRPDTMNICLHSTKAQKCGPGGTT